MLSVVFDFRGTKGYKTKVYWLMVPTFLMFLSLREILFFVHESELSNRCCFLLDRD